MANAREISTRIKSIQDTMKITKAMYMMSSMKLRKARQGYGRCIQPQCVKRGTEDGR